MKEADLLKEGLDRLGIPYAEEQIHSFSVYLAELTKWNRVHNLTGLRSERDIVVKHFLDSLLFLKVLPKGTGSIADVGSGAGFPGIPMKIMRPQLTVFLIESAEKKGIFLRHMKSLLDLRGLEVITSRIEKVSGITVDAAVTRALFGIGDFAEKTGAILRPGGVLVLSKGPKVQEELEGIDREKVSIRDLRLPFGDAVRHLVVVKP